MTSTMPVLPKLPGVYIFKDSANAVIYIGKAKCLAKRVSSYFRKQGLDWKVQELIKEHHTVEHIVTHSETEALLLEAQLIKTFKPKYNVLLKSGNPFLYLCITHGDMPELKVLRVKKEKGIYFGPFLHKQRARGVYDYLVRTLRLRLCTVKIEQGCLNYHLGRCAGNCKAGFDMYEYKTRLTLAQNLLEGNYQACETVLKAQIAHHNAQFEFEKSKNLYTYLQNLSVIFQTLETGFTETKYTKDVSAALTPVQYKIDQPLRALEDLQILLKLEHKPITIDCFDISHFQSSSLVGSCVRFTHGIPDKNNFRRFKIKTLIQQNDYAALREIVMRRYKNPANLPDIILIDGGKGQLSAVNYLTCVANKPCISLAKREERLFTPLHPEGVKLDLQTPSGQMLIALRDYAHHFAITYHQSLRRRALQNST